MKDEEHSNIEPRNPASPTINDWYVAMDGPSLCAWRAPDDPIAHERMQTRRNLAVELNDLVDLVWDDEWIADLVSKAICFAPSLCDGKGIDPAGKKLSDYLEKVAFIEHEARHSKIDPVTTRKVCDRLLEEAHFLLGLDMSTIMARYHIVAEQFLEKLNAPLPAEMQRELDELIKTLRAKEHDSRPTLFKRIDKIIKSVPKHVSVDSLSQEVFVLASKHGLADDPNAQAYLIEKVTAKTFMGKVAVRKLVKKVVAEASAAGRKLKGKKGARPLADLSSLGHRAASEGAYKVMIDQGDDPRRFHNGGRLAEVLTDEAGNIRISAIDKPRLKGGHLEEQIDFVKEDMNVPAPDPLVNRVHNMPLSGYPPLYRITSFPTYSAELALVMTAGYHEVSGLYHQPKAGVNI